MTPQWITSPQWRDDPDGPLPVLAVGVPVTGRIAAARLVLAGVGVWSASVDGVPVSPAVLEPGYADWTVAAEEVDLDLTVVLTAAAGGRSAAGARSTGGQAEVERVLCVALGPGLYRSVDRGDRWTKITTDHGDLAVRAVLTWTDDAGEHALTTGPHWHATTGAVRHSNWVGGEDHDLRHAPNPRAWRVWPAAVVSRAHPPAVRRRTAPPVVVREVRPAVAITRPRPGVAVVDFGVNAAGWPTVRLPAGADVRLRPAELLTDDGEIDPRTQGWGPVFHTVRTGDAEVEWHPAFAYNGLRYLEITGLDEPPALGDVRLQVLGADVVDAGEFACSDERLTAIHRITHRAVWSNLLWVPTDCPQREKLCYLEQLHLAFDVLRWNADVSRICGRAMELAVSAQRDDGHLPLYVPEWNRWEPPWTGDANWGLAIVFTPWLLWETYATTEPLTATLPAALRYVAHLDTLLRDGVLVDGLGDWNGRRPVRYVELVCTASYARALGVLADGCDLLGRDEGPRLRARRAQLLDGLRARFCVATPDGRPRVGTGSAAELAVALDCGLVPSDAAHVEALVALVADAGHVLDVGEVALDALVRVLSRAGRHETLWEVCQVTDAPSYGYVLAHGATSLTETWDGPTFGFSQNHFMHGAADAWLFECVAGLGRPTAPGWREVLLTPRPCGDLTWARAHWTGPVGTLAIGWTRAGARLDVEVTLPAGVRAVLEWPDGAREDLGTGADVRHLRRSGRCAAPR